MPPRGLAPPPMSDLADAISDVVYTTYARALLKQVQDGPIPNHLAIIMDGNRRFAESLGLAPTKGHEMGRDTLDNVVDWCLEVGVRVLTVYAFSTENFDRDADEVQRLMELFAENFRRMGDDDRVHDNEVRVRAIGQIDLLPAEVQEAIAYAEKRSAAYDRLHYNVAVAYGGREEILRAIRSIAEEVAAGELTVGDIDEETVSHRLYTADLPDPDLILRTSGEERISNFLLWQLAYSELYFSDIYWPAFRKVDFLRAIRGYQQRQRRFGE